MNDSPAIITKALRTIEAGFAFIWGYNALGECVVGRIVYPSKPLVWVRHPGTIADIAILQRAVQG